MFTPTRLLFLLLFLGAPPDSAAQEACLGAATVCTSATRAVLLKCRDLATPLARLCCLSAGCNNPVLNDTALTLDLLHASPSGASSRSSCPAWPGSCCPALYGPYNASWGTPYVEDVWMDGTNYRLCSRSPGDAPLVGEVVFQSGAARLQYTPQGCEVATGCTFIQLLPRLPNTVDRVWAFATVTITISNPVGAAFVFPAAVPDGDRRTSLLHFANNRLQGTSGNITAVGLMLRPGYLTWDFDLGCVRCGIVTFDIALWTPPGLKASAPTVDPALPAFMVRMADWASTVVRVTMSCSSPKGSGRTYPQLWQVAHPPGCTRTQSLQQAVTVDGVGRLAVSWDVSECEVFAYVKVPGHNCLRADCLGGVDSVCMASAVSKLPVAVIAEVLIGLFLITFLLLPFLGLAIPALHPTASAGALPPNIWPFEGDSMRKHQAQLLLWPEVERVETVGLFCLRMDFLLLLALAAWVLAWVIVPVHRAPEVALAWLPVVALLAAEAMCRVQGQSLFGGRILWRFVTVGLLLGVVFAHAERFQWQMLNAFKQPRSTPPSLDLGGNDWEWQSPSANLTSRLLADHSPPASVVEGAVRAFVIAVGVTVARVHVAQYTALTKMGLGTSVYEVAALSTLCSAALGAAHLNVIDLVYAMLLPGVASPPCSDPAVCNNHSSRWSGLAPFVLVRLLSVLLYVPTGLLIGLTVATMGRRLETYHRQMLFLLLACVAPQTCVEVLAEWYVHSDGYVVQFLFAPVAIFILCLTALTAGVAWRRIFRPLEIAPEPHAAQLARVVQEVPRQMMCPLTGELMEEPTLVLVCGHYFERQPLLQQLALDPRCPLCRTPASAGDTVMSGELQRFTVEWRAAMMATESPLLSPTSRRLWGTLGLTGGLAEPASSPPRLTLGIPLPQANSLGLVTGLPQVPPPVASDQPPSPRPPEAPADPPAAPESPASPASSTTQQPWVDAEQSPGPRPGAGATDGLLPDSAYPILASPSLSPLSLSLSPEDVRVHEQLLQFEQDMSLDDDARSVTSHSLHDQGHPRTLTLFLGLLLVCLLLFFWVAYSPALLFNSGHSDSGLDWGLPQRLEMCGAIVLGISGSALVLKGVRTACVRHGARRVHAAWLAMYFLTAVVAALPFLLWSADLAAIGTALFDNTTNDQAVLAGQLFGMAALMLVEELWKAYFGNLALKVHTATSETVVLFTVAAAAGWAAAQQTVWTLLLYDALDVVLDTQAHLYVSFFTPLALLAQHLVSGAIIGLRLGFLRREALAQQPPMAPRFRWPLFWPLVLRLMWVFGSVLSYHYSVIIGGVTFAVWLPLCAWLLRRHWRQLWQAPTPAPTP
eukprot:EG_transcript_721